MVSNRLAVLFTKLQDSSDVEVWFYFHRDKRLFKNFPVTVLFANSRESILSNQFKRIKLWNHICPKCRLSVHQDNTQIIWVQPCQWRKQKYMVSSIKHMLPEFLPVSVADCWEFIPLCVRRTCIFINWNHARTHTYALLFFCLPIYTP